MRTRSLAHHALVALVALAAANPATALVVSLRHDRSPAVGHVNIEVPQLDEEETASGQPGPDRVGDLVGGIAARLHVDGRTPVPGELYMLMATPGSEKLARVYDETPYTPAAERERRDMGRSNLVAAELASTLVGHPLSQLDLTVAPGGGPSAGVAYALAYLDIDSAGAFTGDLAIAATGHMQPSGRLVPILGADEKLTAALLADVDVLFTSALPAPDLVELHAARLVGEEPLWRPPIAPGGRAWERYRAWGAEPPDAGLDLVVVHHLGEVAAYLCGAGSELACEAAVELAGPTGPWSAEPAARSVRPSNTPGHARWQVIE